MFASLFARETQLKKWSRAKKVQLINRPEPALGGYLRPGVRKIVRDVSTSVDMTELTQHGNMSDLVANEAEAFAGETEVHWVS